ncbi:hypothetical protein K503DRAFT_771791 [Rhizopogon vinicolor AM-OR11-026]|uniref:DUF6533 domain-containing protein n=1 Tax=Rhizopogon vinicolor AM-OR11-026 TaxID=1314800 RepID=A0A1B7MX22_9AGAM|nr:hypothetical protein K503DRAFT_771791 [Rhizopogon vinicolor AM-OR11-026]
MALVSNDPIFWPTISFYREYSYFTVASFTIVVYDWEMTFGQEVLELIWRQRWSILIVLYLNLSYTGMLFTVIVILANLLTVSLTDAGCSTLHVVVDWVSFVINLMLGGIIIARLHVVENGRMRAR